jgi:hypothetical protein
LFSIFCNEKVKSEKAKRNKKKRKEFKESEEKSKINIRRTKNRNDTLPCLRKY